MEPEARRISRETSTPIYRFANRLEGSRPYVYSVKKTQAGKCMFLKGNICSIYRARPLVCRFYPFELKTKLGRHVFSYTTECPSINHGPTLRREYFVRLFQRLVVLDEKTISTE
jgi:Fe-S-cluster containining protein